MDTAACLTRMHGRTPTVLVTLQDAHEANTSISPNQLFQAASSFWSPTALQLISTASNPQQTKHDNDEVAVSYWTVKSASKKETFAITVFQNLDHEQRIVWAKVQ